MAVVVVLFTVVCAWSSLDKQIQEEADKNDRMSRVGIQGDSMPASLRASTIELTQLAIRDKILYLCLVGGVRLEERSRWALMQEPALLRAPR
jgi:hypothetical protein